MGISVAVKRNGLNIEYTYTEKEPIVISKITSRLILHDSDVIDVNSRPDFSNYFLKMKIIKVNQEKIISESKIINFNSINFKTIIEKHHKICDLVISRKNEELSFLS